MGESVNNEMMVRDYLLGRVSNETTLEGIEELLFTDEEFCSQVALAEDDLINDFVMGRLNQADTESFQARLADNPERRFKLELTQALREKALARNEQTAKDNRGFFASLLFFFRQPVYAGAFAVLLIVVVGLAIYFSRRSGSDDLAELRSIYQQVRPTETRIAEFGYAPLSQLRGEPVAGDKSRLRRIENDLIEAKEKSPNAQTHHALGVFDLTQQKYAEAISEFESALKFAGNDARIHNDLGSAHFELSKKVAKERRFEQLGQSLEEFTKATNLDGNLLEALFNEALARQALGMPRQARESWMLYLQKDPSSRWADEARKNLAEIQNEQTLFKRDPEVLADFLAAYRSRDEARLAKIHDETKGALTPTNLSLQLSRRYLIARSNGSAAEAEECLAALKLIGRYEQEKHTEFFFLN